MTGAELKTLREALGLTLGWMATQVGVAKQTARDWEASADQVPADVATLIQRIDAQTNAMVAQAIATVDATIKVRGRVPESVSLRRYSTDAELWRHHPTAKPLPATWHAAVLARTRQALADRDIASSINDPVNH